MNNQIVDLAYNMALKSQSKFRLGAVLFKRRKIVSTGFNQMHKTHPVMQKHNEEKDITLGLHAEIHSCIGVSASDLLGSELLVCRIYRDGSLALSRPCKVCQSFGRYVGISRIYYSTKSGQFECLEL